jgi:hypothetical protein
VEFTAFAAKSWNVNRGEENEHLDNFVRDIADRMDYRFFGLPCGRRVDSPAARLRGDFSDLALCDGKKRRLMV